MNIRGFAFIELLISMAIVGILVAVSLYNYGAFNGRIAVTNNAYEVASLIREAQTYGVSVRQFNTGAGTPDFTVPYGVHFVQNSPQYFFFADANKNGEYTSSELEAQYELRGSFTVDVICLGPDGSCVNQTAVTITFTRPDPDARIVRSGVEYSQARITFKEVGGSGMTRDVVVYSSGHINVE